MIANFRVVVLRRLLAAGLLVALAASGGCTGDPPASPAASPVNPPPHAAAATGNRETWDVITIKGVRIGYGHTTLRRTTKDGRDVVQGNAFFHTATQRYGQTAVQDLRLATTETPDGQLLDVQSEFRQGPTPLRTTGQVRDGRLELQMTTSGKPVCKSIPWTADDGGFFAVEESLFRQPMKPGEKRTIHELDISNQVFQNDLTARNLERVKLLTGSFTLLRIDLVVRLPDGQTMRGALWTDRSGEVLKNWLEPLEIATFRVPKEVALAKTAPAEVDLGQDVLVKLDRPLPGGHRSRRVRYRVEVQGSDPASVFVSGPSQQVRSTGSHTAEVTVWAIRPGQKDGNSKAAADPPTDASRQPNNFIQSDDAKIVADAKEAADGETDPWKVAVALEHYVHRAMRMVDFTDAFLTAADAARLHRGDCKAHAVYLAALARARGIPARVAVGLVYLQNSNAFGGHMWTEVYIDGRWIPLDATLALGGIGAAHLKLGQNDLGSIAGYAAFLPILQVAGRLKVEVLDAE